MRASCRCTVTVPSEMSTEGTESLEKHGPTALVMTGVYGDVVPGRGARQVPVARLVASDGVSCAPVEVQLVLACGTVQLEPMSRVKPLVAAAGSSGENTDSTLMSSEPSAGVLLSWVSD